MIAKQSVYLNLDRDKAFPEGHEDAKFLLVRAGQEIAQADLDRYEGASDLAEMEAEAKEEVVIPPPNLKDHSATEKSSRNSIPSPKMKGDKEQAPNGEEVAEKILPKRVAKPRVKKKK